MMEVYLGERRVTPVTATLSIALDAGARGFTCTFPWERGEDPKLDVSLAPRSFSPVTVKIDGSLQFTGYLYRRRPSLTVDGSLMEVECFSRTRELIRSATRPPYEFYGLTLKQIAEQLCAPFSIAVTSSDSGESDLVFEEQQTIARTASIFSFLQNLARQRGLLVTDTPEGSLMFISIVSPGGPVGTIIEGSEQKGNVETAENLSINIDDGEIFQTYQTVADTALAFLDAVESSVIDDRIKLPSLLCESVNDETAGGVIKSAEWLRNKKLSESIELPVPVTSWYAPKGELWLPGTLLAVSSPSLFLNKGYNFLIRGVAFQLTPNSETASLDLVPPSLYSTGDFTEPWG